MNEPYEAPRLAVLGEFSALTLQSLDKVGPDADFLTELLPDLDGKIQSDPVVSSITV
jgi:hypothetical protein